MLKKVFRFSSRHRIISAIVIILFAGGGYFGAKALGNKATPTAYVLGSAQKGTIIVSVSGSGQVSASNQLELKSKASSDVTAVNVKLGDQVKAGAVLVQLNSQDVQKSVRDAEINLESAQLSLDKLKQPADALSVLQAENALTDAQSAKQKAENDLAKSHDDGFNAIANAFLNLPSIMSGLDNILFSATFAPGQANIDWYANQSSDNIEGERAKALQYKDDAAKSYSQSRIAYTKNFDDYKSASRDSDKEIIEALIVETYETTRAIADAVKSANNFIDFIQDAMERRKVSIPSAVSTHQSSLDSYTGTTNSHLSSLLSIKTTIQNSKDAIVSADRTIVVKTQTLADLTAGADSLDLRSAELTLKQRQNALADVREKYADYAIRAPFDGVIAALNIKKGDSVSSGAAVGTIITQQKIAEISLNEVDAAKVKAGQKVNLTFDAVPDLNITGEVADIDSIGTVSQGVVTYNTKIVFDTQDDRVKSGMSVSAAIITDLKQDVVFAPNSAVKSAGNSYYVEMPDEDVGANPSAANNGGIILKKSPKRQAVEIGLADDINTEIVGGLSEGETIVTRTISSTSNSSGQSQSQSLFQVGGAGRTGGF